MNVNVQSSGKRTKQIKKNWKTVSLDVRARHRELGKESISRDQAQRHTMFIVWKMRRCEQRKIQDPGSKPAENGILNQVRKVFKKKRVNNIKRIGDFDSKFLGRT